MEEKKITVVKKKVTTLPKPKLSPYDENLITSIELFSMTIDCEEIVEKKNLSIRIKNMTINDLIKNVLNNIKNNESLSGNQF
jgi:hypothetical protein